MAFVSIYMTAADLAAAARIAKKMVPHAPPEECYVAAGALVLGMERLRVIWGDALIAELEKP